MVRNIETRFEENDMIQIELFKVGRCYKARLRICGRVRKTSQKYRKWSSAIDYIVNWLQQNWSTEVL